MQFLDKITRYLNKQSKTQLDKGRRITSFKTIELKESADKESYTLKVPSESSRDTYTVDIYDLKRSPNLGTDCDCIAFFDDEDCKHCVAATIILQNRLSAETIEIPASKSAGTQKVKLDEDGYFHFKMDSITVYTLQKLAGNITQSTISKTVVNIKPGPLNMPHQCFSYYEKSKKICDIDLVFDRTDNFKTRCTCGNKTNPLCKHVIGGFV